MKSDLSQPVPFVSVIMPIRNEADFIRRSLGAVLAQDYPHVRMEVLVADGISTDGTRDMVNKLGEGSDIEVRLLDNRGLIAPVGLNVALAQAVGEIIVRVDGHCEIAPDYVSKCVYHLLGSDIDGVGGPIDTIGETMMSRAVAMAMSSVFGVGGSAFRTVKDREMLADTVAFPAYTRKAMELAGPFDEELVRNQDDEYNYRLRKMGGKILLAPDIHSRYYSRSTLRGLWRQYFQYGFWKVRVMQKHPGQMSARQFAPPLFGMSLLLFGLLAPVSRRARRLLALDAGVYIVANLTASAWTTRKGGVKYLPLLPLVYATLHLSYGMGFVAGLIRFGRRWV